MQGCLDYNLLIRLMRPKLEGYRPFLDYKWLQSEKVGQDIGFERAALEFIATREFEELFQNIQPNHCGHDCPERYNCRLSLEFVPEHHIPGHFLG